MQLPDLMREGEWNTAKYHIFFNNWEVIWVICTSICHLASHSNHPYLVPMGPHN